jgi:hypothetical protein
MPCPYRGRIVFLTFTCSLYGKVVWIKRAVGATQGLPLEMLYIS